VIPHHLIIKAPDTQPRRTAVLLHGILGSAKNWRQFARVFARHNPEWRLVLVDLRNHGLSTGAIPPHTLDSCADDLHELFTVLEGAPDLLIGHSFGGKVALSYAARHTNQDTALVILDTNPGAPNDLPGRLGTGNFRDILQCLTTTPMPVRERSDILDRFTEAGFSRALGLWMTTNLKRTDGGFRWSFDLEGVEALLRSYFATDHFPTLEKLTCPITLVRASETQWPEVDNARLIALSDRAPHFHYAILEESGHWVHVDNPEGLRHLLTQVTGSL
jgi:esterase